MDINSILNQVLGAGQEYSRHSSRSGGLSGSGLGGLLQSALGGSNAKSNASLGGMLQNALGGSNARASANPLGGLLQSSDALKKLGGGAAAAGILSMILGGSNGSRGMSGSLAKMGSLATIGTLAYQAYQSWQRSNQGSVQQNATPSAAAPSYPELRPSAERSHQEVENNSRLILKAMIAAACADGEISAAEQQAILEQVGTEDREAQTWLNQIISNPPRVEQIAAEVGNDQGLAAEVYLASRIVCGDLDRKEIVYLANLQRALGLRDSFVELLEKQAGL